MENNLWQKYCSFLDKDFGSQIRWNTNYLNQYIDEWKNTKMAARLCPKGVKSIEDVPLTTYSDYPILHEFGAKLKALEESMPRKRGENHYDYYDKLSRSIIDLLDGWMADKYSFCSKTSGTSGESKLVVHGETFWKNMLRSMMSTIAICVSNEHGKTSLSKGDIFFGISAPAPYIGAYVSKAIRSEGFTLIPPFEIIDEESNFRKKMIIAFKSVEKAGKVDIYGGGASLIKLISLYFTNKADLFRETYETTNLGIIKALLWFLWKYEQAFGKKYDKLKEVINLKGLILGQFDTELYFDFTKEQLEIEPLEFYGANEIGFPLYGRPERKFSLSPDLQTGYFEFLDKNKNIRKINELEKGEVYELVFTPFRSIVMRYKIGDLFKVVDFYKDGLPIFSFESRIIQMLDIYDYFRLSFSLASKVFKKAGFPPLDNWAFTKEIEPKEHLVLLMEKELDLTETQVAEKIFDALKIEDQEFQNYIKDFKVKNPEEVIKVEYLKRGTFSRYTAKKIQEGAPMGMIKPSRIIPPEKKEIIDLLRSL